MATKVNLTSLYNGVGKTSLIVLLARQLQSEGYKVLIIDNSYKVSRLPSMFGVPRVERSLGEIIPLMKMSDFTYTVLETYINVIDDSIDVIGCSRKDVMDPVTMGAMVDLLDFYGDYDYILIESPVRYKMQTVANIFVVDGRLPDYKQLQEEGSLALINKYDSLSGMSLRKLGKGVLAFPYEPTMVSYELMGKHKFSDDFYDSLETLLDLIDEISSTTKKKAEPPAKSKPNKTKQKPVKSKRRDYDEDDDEYEDEDEYEDYEDEYDDDEDEYDEYDDEDADEDYEEPVRKKSKSSKKSSSKTKRMSLTQPSKKKGRGR